MSQKQLQRIVGIENAVAGLVSVAKAAQALGRNEWQVKRLKQVFDCSEPRWVLHGSQGRAPANRMAEQLRRRVSARTTTKSGG